MPVGLIFMKWNEITGNEILAKYPEDLDISNRTLLQLFHTHEYTGERGMISLMVGTSHIASYYTGPESNYCIAILLGLGEDPDEYEGALADVAQIFLQNLEDEDYIELVPNLFQYLIDYPQFNKEQQLIYLYNNEIKRWILNRLREEGILSKSQLEIWLRQTFPNGFGDIDLTLFEFVQNDLIQMHSIKNERSVLLFLINDLIMLRIPPFKILNNFNNFGLPKDLEAIFKEKIKLFFETYKHSEEDNLKIINILSNPRVYVIFDMLRNSILNKSDFEKLKNKGLKELDNAFKLLIDAQIITSLKDPSGNEYYILISDFYVKSFIPQYILNVLKDNFNNKTKSEPVLIKYLNILEETYKETL